MRGPERFVCAGKSNSRSNNSNSKSAALTLIVAALCGGWAPEDPYAVEADWSLERVIAFEHGQAAHFNPVDGMIYVARRGGSMPDGADGVYRVLADDSVEKVADGDRPAALAVDPRDGDVFFTEDFGGAVYRVPMGESTAELWVSGLHAGDDDPVGLCFPPVGYTGGVIGEGEVLLVDRGFNGLDELWVFSASAMEGESPLHADMGTLEDAVDVTIGESGVFVADRAGGPAGEGRMFRVDEDGSLTEVVAGEPVNPTGVATDPQSGWLAVLDAEGDRVVWMHPETGAVEPFLEGFSFTLAESDTPWAGVDFSPEGSRIVVTDRGAQALYVFAYFADADEDGVEDAEDNCPEHANPGQEDFDGDGAGDACDDDDDNDGLSDADEEALGSDPLNPDTDGDGLPDGEDPDPLTPGDPAEELADELRDLARHIRRLELDLFDAPGRAARAHRMILANRAGRAARWLDHGKPRLAAAAVRRILARVDGERQPEVWMKRSVERDELAAWCAELLASMEGPPRS